MAQTTGGMSACALRTDYSFTGGTPFTDISGFAGKVEAAAQTRMSGEYFTFDGDTPIITMGKRSSVEVTTEIVYTAGTADAFQAIRARFRAACGSLFTQRWSPEGGGTGDYQFSTSTTQSYLSEFADPSGEAASADPIVTSFKVITSDVALAVVA